MNAQPPVFRGEPDLSASVRDFSWLDFRRGEGEFRAEVNNRAEWKHIGKTSKGGVAVSIYSRRVKDTGDTETRAEWDSTTTSVVELSFNGPCPEAGELKQRERILHWHVKYPWPLGKRDYVFSQSLHSEVDDDGNTFRCIQNRALPSARSITLKPLERGVTRVDDYRSNMVIWEETKDEDTHETCFAVLYFESPKVNLPSWVQSQVAASTIPSSLAAAIPVGEQYPLERIHKTLRRYGIGVQAMVHHGFDPPSCEDASAEEDAFYSASDEEDNTPRTPSRGAVSPLPGAASPMPSAAVSPKQSGDGVVRSAARRGTSAGLEKEIADLKYDKKRAKRSIASQIVRWSCGEPQKKREDRGEDLEEGLLILSPEEKDLLLKVLAETRARQATAWNWCCPCRRHHKQ